MMNQYPSKEDDEQWFECQKQLFKSDLDQVAKRPKINRNGMYQAWHGCTIIMNVIMDDIPMYNELYKIMSANKDITHGLALLPVDSYHVTLKGLFNQTDELKQYNTLIDEHMNKFIELDRLFMNAKTDEKCFVEFERCGEQYDGCTWLVKTVNEQDELKLRQLENTIIKEIPGVDRRLQRWHLTLGYNFGSRETQERLKYALRTIEMPRRIRVERPRVCWFNDMTKFNPIQYDN